MLKVGDPLPPFELAQDAGPVVSAANLSAGTVVLYFYPKDDTPGCTVQACAFRDLGAEFAAAGARIIGVSADSVESHAAFRAKFNLDFPLLADTDAALCKAVGVWGPQSFQGHEFIGIARTTFVIHDGRVAEVYPNVSVHEHAERMLERVKGLNS